MCLARRKAMIKKLRGKFIAVTMAVLVIVFLIVFATINISMHLDSIRQTDQLLEMLVDNDGNPPFFRDDLKEKEFMPKEDDFRPESLENQQPKSEKPNDFNRVNRFFYVKTDEDFKATEYSFNMMYDFSEADADEYLEAAIAKRGESGSLSSMQFLRGSKDYGYIFVFAERSVEIGMLVTLRNISLWAAGISCIVLLVFVFFLSKWIVRPVEEAFEKQKRFISDASHELKTPLTIISANADVLEHEIGENVRLTHIQSQTERMGTLVTELLELARTDEQGMSAVFSEFDLSQATLETTLEFESRAFESGKLLEYDIADSIMFTGNESRIKQLVAILVDNAFNHSNEHGRIVVKLYESGAKKSIYVFNSGTKIDESETDKIFERFYRSDLSRSRETGGYGLGLSIAKSIVDMHKGKIIASAKEDGTLFLVRL